MEQLIIGNYKIKIPDLFDGTKQALEELFVVCKLLGYSVDQKVIKSSWDDWDSEHDEQPVLYEIEVLHWEGHLLFSISFDESTKKELEKINIGIFESKLSRKLQEGLFRCYWREHLIEACDKIKLAL